MDMVCHVAFGLEIVGLRCETESGLVTVSDKHVISCLQIDLVLSSRHSKVLSLDDDKYKLSVKER